MLRKTDDVHTPSDMAMLREATRHVPFDASNPCASIRKNFEALKSHKSLASERSKKGSWFEACFLDGLIQAGVDPARIEHGVHLSVEKVVEVDLIVHPKRRTESINAWTFCFMLKTSLRERWKQWDRDASAVPFYSLKSPYVIAVFHTEQEHYSAEQNIALASRRQENCIHVRKIFTIHDDTRVNQVIRHMAK